MSESLEPAVPPALRAALDREPAGDGSDVTVLVLVVREDGWPHVAMVGPGELVVLDDRHLALALWPRSTATKRLTPAGRLTLTAVLDGASYAVRATARRLEDLETPLAGRVARFEAEVEAATSDDAPYAVLESGVRFRLKEPDQTLSRWQEVRTALRNGT